MKVNRLRILLTSVLVVLSVALARAQDSVDVTFRYTNPAVAGVTLPGEFNGWNNTAWPMTNQGGGLWTRTARLRLGGNPTPPSVGVPGAWQYKFYYTGVGAWPNDPLNHHVNPADNDNSFLYIKDPTLYQILPNQRQPLLNTASPTITAYIFPKVGATVDTSSIRLIIDGTTYAGLGAFYNATTSRLSYPLPFAIPNGSHTLVLRASSSAAGANADTVTFATQGGFVQILTQGGYTTRTSQLTLNGIVQDSAATSVKLVRNATDTLTVAVAGEKFTTAVSLVEGVNTFRAIADSGGLPAFSSPMSLTRFVNHAPNALLTFSDQTSSIELQATGSTDPDSGQTTTLTYSWSEDPANPSVIGGINGATASLISISRPAVQGEYYFGLVASDVNGNRDTTRNFFVVNATPPITVPSIASVPQWVREGRMYSMFFKMHTAAGTINAAYPDLDRIAKIGYNIIWVLPVMRNRNTINNGPGPGYEIVDFYTVAPEYGTNQDFKNFVTRAHQLGMKVILDVTPNHTSSSHPFVLDARTFRENSRYWSYYQHQFITYSGTGLGELSQAITGDGFVYYNGFSDALLNYNWANVDARQEMIDVYSYWIKNIGVDGYRFDVYWGPFIRTNSPNGGDTEMGQPVRQALKHIRPDIHLLGEASGTGPGTERMYADFATPPGGHGVDAAYDWSLKGFVQNQNGNIWALDPATRANNFDARLRNASANAGMGFLPGPNSYYLRFLENHDEDRISYVYGSGVDAATARARTMPMSTAVNLAVGLPMVYAGQEVGRGYGITDFDQRRRGVVDFGDPAGQILMPHYQKLAQIRKQFAAFTSQSMVRVTTDVAGVYAYTRPSAVLNGLVVVNLDGLPHTANVSLSTAGSPAPLAGLSDGVSYVVTDLYNGGTTQNIMFTAGAATLPVSLPAYGSAVFVIAGSAQVLVLPSLTAAGESSGPGVPDVLSLYQNYPNPFNPATTIRYEIPVSGKISLRVIDVLGREVVSLFDGPSSSGRFSLVWDGRTSGGTIAGSGIYFCRLTAPDGKNGDRVIVRKMVLLK